MAHPRTMRPGMLLDLGAPINRGQIAWWPMWEGAGGKALDISGKGKHGTLTNGPTWSGGGIKFDGTDDYIAAPALTELQSSNTFTVMIEAASNAFGGGASLAALAIRNGTDFTNALLSIYPYDALTANGPLIWYNGAVRINVDTGYPTANGQFNTFLFKSNSSTSHELYTNGILAGSSSASITMSATLSDTTIGAWHPGAQWFPGRVRNVRVWNRPLGIPEIQALALNPADGLWVPDVTRYYIPAAGAYILSADPGAMAIIGAAASPLAGRILSADPGAMAIIGAAASPLAGRILSGDAGSYSITGASASTIADRTITASPGSISITGLDAGVFADRMLSASPGAIVITGLAASLVGTTAGAYALSADPGSMAITGAASGIIADRIITALSGSISVTGFDAGIIADRLLSAAPGAYSVTGASASAIAARMLSADPGAYVITGLSVGFGVPALATYAVEIVILADAREIVILDDPREIVVH